MRRARLRNHIRNNVVGYIALFAFAMSGTATALTGSNTVFSDDIVDGEVKSPDIRNAAVTGTKVRGDTIRGSDVAESTLGQVPSALTSTLGGLGRYGYTGSCDPESETFVDCSFVTVTLPAPARLLVIGTARAHTEIDSDQAVGSCRIGTTAGPVLASQDWVHLADDGPLYEVLPVMAVTNVFPAGTHSFGIDCMQAGPGAIEYHQARVVAVALSGG